MTFTERTIVATRRWLLTGYCVSAFVSLLLTLDAIVKILQLAPAVEATTGLGYPVDSVLWLGVIELACVVLYLLPFTSVLGALLLTGYLGGAIASHVRVESPLFTHILFPAYIALLLWGGLYLRQAGVRALVPIMRAIAGRRAEEDTHVVPGLPR